MAEMTEHMQEYFEKISSQVKGAYDIANKARAVGYDPEKTVGMPLAKNMAERVVALISSKQPQLSQANIPQRILELEGKFGKLDWRVALSIGLEVAQQKHCTFESELIAIETGIRLGIAYLTSGIVSSPLEGFVELKLKKTRQGKDYFCVMYSGPIRSAGGTAGAVSVILIDYIRKKMGYAPYDPQEKEINRAVTELYDYHDRVTNLQYLPSEEEITFMARNLSVQIDGDPSEKIEVSNYKDLDRIETNRIRSGMCLVMGECLCQKSAKLWKQLNKWGKDFDLDHWNFMEEFIAIQKKSKAKSTSASQKKEAQKISPDFTFIKDLVAGRPVLTHPMRQGGFRLRYGRCRTSGYSAAAMHPATMIILNDYIGVGTQLKLERPGKAASMNTCDTIDGPVVKLKDGSVLYIQTTKQAKEHLSQVKEILYLGDILISFGDFTNRAHVLVPAGYCEEWWARELDQASRNQDTQPNQTTTRFVNEPFTHKPSFNEAVHLSKQYAIPLHPSFIYHYNAISTDQLKQILIALSNANVEKHEDIITKIVLPKNDDVKRAFELIGMPHLYVNNEYIVIQKHHAQTIALVTNLEKNNKLSEMIKDCSEKKNISPLELINDHTEKIEIRDKSGTFIGARMGRPEKAKMRKMTGDPHMLFPIGEEGGKMRSLNAALEKGSISAEFELYVCEKTGKESLFSVSDHDDKAVATKKFYSQSQGYTEKKIDNTSFSFRRKRINIIEHFTNSLKKFNIQDYPDLIKGVRGTSNKEHTPEHYVKGILRAKHGVYVNKDGTIRYDMTQLPITHFKQKEIGTSIEKLKELGYTHDHKQQPLENADQILELKPQDMILPACPHALEAGADTVLFNAANFMDDLLKTFYNVKSYYNLTSPSELAGHLVLALAPHTSAGIVGRIIGFSKTQGFYAHPMIHAATRRDCDGDEASVTLLLDALINFSAKFLPNSRGASQDAPLVLTSLVIPSEVDDMLFDIDIDPHYPLELYEAAQRYEPPFNVNVKKFNAVLNTHNQYEGLSFTHDASSMNEGVLCSSYKTIPSMKEKLEGQMILAENIRAVDEVDVARLVIEKHFIRDIKGNLRKFSSQQFRCSTCNAKYRRVPLIGKCTKCDGTIIFTISFGSIVKYLEPSLSLADKYDLPTYIKQTLQVTKQMVEEVFGREKEKQLGLGRWFDA